MNSGQIASRYALAFHELVEGSGAADAVYGQVRVILSAMGRLPKFRLALTDPRALPLEEKLRLLEASVAPQQLQGAIADLLTLMHRKGRSEFFRLSLLDFLDLYRQKRGLVMVQLTTATAREDLVEPIERMVKDDFGKTAVVNSIVDPDIVGGFIFETWGHRLDASVRTALEQLRDELIQINRRLV